MLAIDIKVCMVIFELKGRRILMNVTVYSTQSCIWCKRVKDYLKQNSIEFKSVDVGVNREAARDMVSKTGQMGVPVVDVDGRYIVGFDKISLDDALGIKS